MSGSDVSGELSGYRSSRLRAWVATGALAVVTLTETLVVGTALVEQLVLPDWEAQLEQGDIGAAALAMALTLFGLGLFATYIAAVATFLSWLHLVAQNARVLADGVFRTSPGMAVACWFIPILNWLRPYQVLRELYVKSAPAGPKMPADWIRRAPAILPVWWATWLISNLLGNVSLRLSFSDTPGSARTSMWLDVVSLPVSALAAVGAVAVLWSVQVRQEALAKLGSHAP